MSIARNPSIVGLFVLQALSTMIFSSLCSAFQELSRGQTVYVSVDANVLIAPRGVPFSLGVTLVVRNTDMSNSLKVTTVDLYDTEGKLLKRFGEPPLELRPLETKYIHLRESENLGGLGSNFIVRWGASSEINTPIVECLMIGTRSGQGISFTSPGKVIKEHSH